MQKLLQVLTLDITSTHPLIAFPQIRDNLSTFSPKAPQNHFAAPLLLQCHHQL